MTEPTDLFGHLDGGEELSLFGPGDDRMQPGPRGLTSDPDTIRQRLTVVLETA
jgi:hypothetical protein